LKKLKKLSEFSPDGYFFEALLTTPDIPGRFMNEEDMKGMNYTSKRKLYKKSFLYVTSFTG
jgi:hypothetical protein